MQLTDELVTQWGMNIGIPIVIGLLFFIIWDIAKKSRAGRFGTLILFIILGAGFVTYIIKDVMVHVVDQRIQDELETPTVTITTVTEAGRAASSTTTLSS